jgi:hypothetical protein
MKAMVEVLGATSTTEDVLSGLSLHGKRILVTGVSAGLGVETAVSCRPRRPGCRCGAGLDEGKSGCRTGAQGHCIQGRKLWTGSA